MLKNICSDTLLGLCHVANVTLLLATSLPFTYSHHVLSLPNPSFPEYSLQFNNLQWRRYKLVMRDFKRCENIFSLCSPCLPNLVSPFQPDLVFPSFLLSLKRNLVFFFFFDKLWFTLTQCFSSFVSFYWC